MVLADGKCSLTNTPGEPRVKGSSNLVRVTASSAVLNNLLECRLVFEHTPIKLKLVRFDVRSVLRKVLEPDRSLSFKRDLVREAAQRRYRVEQPASARG